MAGDLGSEEIAAAQNELNQALASGAHPSDASHRWTVKWAGRLMETVRAAPAAPDEVLDRVATAMWRERERHFPKFTQHDPDEIDHATGAWAVMVAMARAGLVAAGSTVGARAERLL